MKSYNHLYEKFISDENIEIAIKNAVKNKGKKKKYAPLVNAYKKNPEKVIARFRSYVQNFHNDKHKPIEIYDGITRKKRTIIVPTVRETVIHHMIVNVLRPIFMKSMYHHSYGSIPGRGAHMGKKYIERYIRKGKNIKYCLKMDIRKYFENVSIRVLKEKLRKIIHDERFLKIVFTVIDVADNGIPLGFYTSQWFANFYLTDLDHYIKQNLKAESYYRYMDDMIIFGSNKRKLHQMRKAVDDYIKRLELQLKDNWQIFRFDYMRKGKHYGRDLDFMGFRFFRDKTLLRKSILLKATRKAKRLSHKEKPTLYDIRQMMSYIGWIDATDTYGIYKERIKPFVNFQTYKRRISRHDKRKEAA